MSSSESVQTPAPPLAERFSSVSEIGVQLDARLKRHVDRIEVQYRIENHRRDDIYVMNQVRSRAVDGAIEYLADNVYVDVAEETLQLTKAALLVRNTFPAVYEYPDAHLVAAGGSLVETFAVSVPVKVRIPYSSKKKRGEVRASKKAVVRDVVFAIGVVPAATGCTFSHERPEYPDVVTVRGATAEPGGGLLLMGQTLLSVRFELGEDLPVLDYEEFPWH
jgi:hypothetical protein